MTARYSLPPGRCTYCGIDTYPAGSEEVRADRSCAATRDHVVPRSFGGERLGTVLACEGCNKARQNAPIEIFRFYMNTVGYDQAAPARVKGFRDFRVLCELAGYRAARRAARRARAAPPRPVKSIGDILVNIGAAP